MASARATKLTFATLTTAILIAVMAALIFATPNSALAAGPDRPTDLVATAVNHDTVSLTWNHPDPTTVDHYQVLSRRVDSGTRLLQVGTSTTTSFDHDGLEPESTYIYRVKPVNSGGEEGQRSARAEATTPAEETPEPMPDPTPAPPQRSDDKGQDNIARASHVVLVSSDWSLTPAGLPSGAQFRLIFLSSTKRDGSSTNIANYNTFVKTRAAAGDTDIQAYSDGFKAVGCTEDVDATDNTSTTGTGVPIYWLNGNKAADDYDDFYDGTWDDEANDKNELGENGPDTSQTTNYPLTGCLDDGTEAVSGSNSRGLGGSLVRLGRPNSSASGNGPLSSSSNVGNSADRPMYGLSGVFQVAEANTTLVSNTGQTSADFTTDAIDYGQGFTTGSDTAGYTLTSIDIGYNDSSNTAFSASIWSSFTADNSPDSLLYSLTPPATFSAGNLTFTAPANATLTLDTTYFIMLALADSGSITVKRTATINSNEDADAAAGWSIADTYVFYSGGWGTSSSNKPLLVAVKGTVYAGSNDATLSGLELEGATGSEPIDLSPAFDADTITYTAVVANRINEVKLTATKNDSNATVVITNDDDLNTPGEAELDLIVGSNTLTVTVTAEDGTPQPYTITVTRAAAPPVPTDCPADTDWCTTMGVGNSGATTTPVKVYISGYRSDRSFGDLGSTMFSHGGTSYSVSGIYRIKVLDGTTVISEHFNLLVSSDLPDGTVLQVGSRTFTVGTDSVTGAAGHEAWDIQADPLNWTEGQHVTVSLKFPITDPAGVTVSPTALTVTEEDPTGASYTVVLDSQPTANVTITIGGQGAADITATPTPLTFTTTNWATAQTVTVTAANDTDTVADSHSLTHSAASSDTDYSSIPIANVGVTVNDNDSAIPALSFDSINITVDEDDSQATLSVLLSQTSTATVTVDYATSDGSALAGGDYTATSGTLTFAPGETVKAITVPILDDAAYEPHATVRCKAEQPHRSNATALPRSRDQHP